jgi:hypothetical protein
VLFILCNNHVIPVGANSLKWAIEAMVVPMAAGILILLTVSPTTIEGPTAPSSPVLPPQGGVGGGIPAETQVRRTQCEALVVDVRV